MDPPTNTQKISTATSAHRYHSVQPKTQKIGKKDHQLGSGKKKISKTKNMSTIFNPIV